MSGSVFDLKIRMGRGRESKLVTMIDPEGGDVEAATRIAERQFGRRRVLIVRNRDEWRKRTAQCFE